MLCVFIFCLHKIIFEMEPKNIFIWIKFVTDSSISLHYLFYIGQGHSGSGACFGNIAQERGNTPWTEHHSPHFHTHSHLGPIWSHQSIPSFWMMKGGDPEEHSHRYRESIETF